MKKILLAMKIVIALALFVLFLLPSLSVEVDAGLAKDPHLHAGAATLCYNLSNMNCDSIPN